MDAITHADALELFKMPRKLGVTAGGEEMITNFGRFGPYIKYGAKYVSLKTDDPFTITTERALEVIREKEIADANRLILDYPEAAIQVLNGRYGPYIKDKDRNAKVPKGREPKSLTLEECVALLAAAPVRKFGKWGRKTAKSKTTAAPASQAGTPAAGAPAAAASPAKPRSRKSPGAPKPGAPKPAAREQAAPKPAAPRQAAPKPVAPTPTASKPTASKPTASKPAALTPAAPKPAAPRPLQAAAKGKLASAKKSLSRKPPGPGSPVRPARSGSGSGSPGRSAAAKPSLKKKSA
jgi:DNA topoisomerase-1